MSILPTLCISGKLDLTVQPQMPFHDKTTKACAFRSYANFENVHFARIAKSLRNSHLTFVNVL